MGQQQLILLVLAVVIVGLAIMVGIRAYTTNSIRANADAMTQDAIRLASDLQAWKQKPPAFGGQPAGTAKLDTLDYSGIQSARELGYTPDALEAAGTPQIENLNGCYTITITSTSTTIKGYNQTLDTEVSIILDGIKDTNIKSTQGHPLLGNASQSGATYLCNGDAK